MGKARKHKRGRKSEKPITLPAHREQAGATEKRRTPDRIEPTAQMKRHKAIASGGEVGNPLSYSPICKEYRDALELFFEHKRAAGWGVRCKVATLDDSPRGPAADPDLEAAEDAHKATRYELADAALLLAGTAAHRAVHNLFVFRNVMGSLPDLERGAAALAEHYHIELEEESAA